MRGGRERTSEQRFAFFGSLLAILGCALLLAFGYREPDTRMSTGWSDVVLRPSPGAAGLGTPIALARRLATEPATQQTQRPECPVDTIERPRWPKKIRHKVVPRETLHQIAYRYGVTPWELRGWNGLPDDLERVRKGTRLEVKAKQIPPPRREVQYEVVQGDTWWRVAARHGVDSKDLRSYNWPYRGKMKPGSVLDIWVDPIVYGWLSNVDEVLVEPDSGRIRPGAVGVGTPNDGRLIGGIPIPEGEGYEIRFPSSAYGTTHAIRQLQTALASFRKVSQYEGTLRIGTMSNPRGGQVGHHRSHQSGRDLDIRLPRKADVPTGVPLTFRRIDWLATFALLEAFVATDVIVIFLDYKTQKRVYRAAKAAGVSEERLEAVLQYPRGAYARVAPVRHSSGHDKHMHVRFGCGPCEPECMESSAAEDEP